VVPRTRWCQPHASPPSDVIATGRVDEAVDGVGDGEADGDAEGSTVADATATTGSAVVARDAHADAMSAKLRAAIPSAGRRSELLTFVHHPFTPVRAIPRTKYRWKIRNRISRGSVASTEPAITCVHKTCRPCTKNVRPSGSV